MQKRKVLVVFGTRPEAIKLVPVIHELGRYPDIFQPLVCVTGQHREMLDQVLDIFGITPDFDLDIMQPGQDLFDVTSRILTGMRGVLEKVVPDLVLVHGDTTTSFAAALASFYNQIPVGHVEAGLRTDNIYSPWPEEMNRRLTGKLASFHFAPTARSRDNLLREGVSPDSILVTGNTVIDTLNQVSNRLRVDKDLYRTVMHETAECGYDIKRIEEGRRMVLITGHRRENFGEGFRSICLAIGDLALNFPKVDFVYPMHLNPNVRRSIRDVFGINNDQCRNLFFIEPLPYFSFILMMSKSSILLTDSGGIQEEAPGLGKPVIVMRDTTERPEAVEAGTVKLAGTDRNLIVEEINNLLTDEEAYLRMSRAINPYGDGKAATRIVDFIKDIF